MAFLQRGFAGLRQGVLAKVRLAPGSSVFQGLAASQCQAVRGFAESSYLSKSDVTARVLDIVKNFEKVDAGKVTESAAFQKDLGLDSLDTVELVMALEEEFAIEIPDAEADKILSVSEAVSYITSNPLAK
uniref:Acyl carrier protein n=1 Tax=Helicosporidium sp. subsp. Simulium jonesii TaxID=145475 RepID=Q5YBA5_HELSJ|nr:mitochondrial acyl carrier protein [Helicosporidium sp. ex Simulium jonesi]